jgi:hypothetical protein
MLTLTFGIDLCRFWSVGGPVRLITLLLLSSASPQALAFSSYYIIPPSIASSATASSLPLQLSLARSRPLGKTLSDNRSAFVPKANCAAKLIALQLGSNEPAPKGLVARIKDTALKAGGVMLLAFIAYNIALGALKTLVFWICSGVLAGSAYFTWNFFKGRKRSENNKL